MPWNVPAHVKASVRTPRASPYLRRNPQYTPSELGRRSSRERQEKNSARICAIDDQMRNPMRQSLGFARTCSGYYEERL